MEAKLREYRARRRREQILENTKEETEEIKKVVERMDKEKNEDEVLLLEEEQPPPRFIPLQTEDHIEEGSEVYEDPIAEESQVSWHYFIIKWTLYSIIWITLYVFFLKQGFGAVFFVVSALIFICVNTRTRRKQPGEVSAYSVFNKDCKSIEGTLDAETLQQQMIYGAAGGLRLF